MTTIIAIRYTYLFIVQVTLIVRVGTVKYNIFYFHVLGMNVKKNTKYRRVNSYKSKYTIRRNRVTCHWHIIFCLSAKTFSIFLHIIVSDQRPRVKKIIIKLEYLTICRVRSLYIIVMVSRIRIVWMTSRIRTARGVQKMTLFVTFTTLCDIFERYIYILYVYKQ